MIGMQYFHLSLKYINKKMIQDNTQKNNPKIPKLTVVSSYFYPKIGGLETIAYTTAKELHNSGQYIVSIITSNYDGRGYKKEIIDGMTVHRLPIQFTISNTPINFSWFSKIKNIFVEEGTTLVHTHSPVPFMADIAINVAKRMNIPTVATYHSGSMKKGNNFFDPIIYVYEHYFLRKLFKDATKVVTVHQAFMKNNYPEVSFKTSFIPTGVDLNRFRITPLIDKDLKATFIGRIEMSSMWKGIDQLIPSFVEVLKEVPNARLELVGGGDALDFYKKMAEEYGISKSVDILGPKYKDDLVKIYKDTRVVVLPSTSDSEAFSVTLVEAMASGRPIIGTNSGGTPQVIKNEFNGLLVEPKDQKALAEAMVKVFKEINFAQKLADNGARMSRDFSWEIQIEKYDRLFKEIIK